jgi:predicted AlkP superfamily phosphohydrolase/phosphomutase
LGFSAANMRNLVNSLLGGQSAALFLVQTIFLLNPRVPFDAKTFFQVWIVFALTLGLALGLGFWLMLFVFEQIRGGAVRPAWVSFRLQTWLLVLTLALAAGLLWHNLFYYRLYLPPDHIRAVATAAATLSAGAAILLVLGLFHYSFGRRAAYIGYALFSVIAVASLCLPFAVRPSVETESPSVPRLPLEDSPSPHRLTIIGMEAASMSYILPAIAEGKLPNFARLIEGGASGALRTLHPTESLAVWTTVATGKLPREHGLHGFYRYRFFGKTPPFSLLPRGLQIRRMERLGLLKRSAVTSSLRRTETLWSILTSFGVKVGLVRWWGTYPAEPINGFVVSELFHRQVREQFEPPLPDLTYPADLWRELLPYVVRRQDIDETEIQRYVDSSLEIPGDKIQWEPLLRNALADDATYHAIGQALRETQAPEVYGVYFFGLDSVSHAFFRYHQPESFGNVNEIELKKYGRVVEAYYNHLDTILGDYLQSRHPDEILVVLSGHGMEPLPLTRRILEDFKGNENLFGYHETGPDGMLCLYGPGIARGAKIQGASVVDVTPTLLYLMGLPLGQDMDGTLLADVLEESLSRSQPATFISSYRNFLIEPRKEEPAYDTPSPLDALPAVLDGRE